MIARLLISPDLENRVNKIKGMLTDEKINSNHPDLLYFPYDSKLGISEARKIKEHFSLKPYSAKGRIVVLEDAGSLTVEAQNALLKTMEEPPEYAVILLGAKSESDLLPTVLSRCQIVILDSQSVIPADLSRAKSREAGIQKTEKARILETQVQDDIGMLLRSSIEERFEYIEKLKDRKEFLYEMVVYFRGALQTPGVHFERLDVLKFSKDLLQAEEWTAQNVNIRAILEYLMLVMPTKI